MPLALSSVGRKQIKKQKPRRIVPVQEHADGIIPAIDY
jgi:hypothetical protein